MPALRSAETATPESITDELEKLIFEQRNSISIVAINAPENAAKGINPVAKGKKASNIITAKPAPELTPMIPGEARELPVTACKSTPEAERPAPARRPAAILGRRNE